MVAVHSYGVKACDVIGFRSGYKGLSVSALIAFYQHAECAQCLMYTVVCVTNMHMLQKERQAYGHLNATPTLHTLPLVYDLGVVHVQEPSKYAPIPLSDDIVGNIHNLGGTILGSGRGGFDEKTIMQQCIQQVCPRTC